MLRASVWLLVALLGCGEGSGFIGVMQNDTTGTGSGSLAASVQVQGTAFAPTLVNLRRGGIVTWVWNDTTVQHNVTFNDPLLSSQTQSTGLHSIVFQTAGTFNYACTVHPGQTGSIVVR